MPVGAGDGRLRRRAGSGGGFGGGFGATFQFGDDFGILVVAVCTCIGTLSIPARRWFSGNRDAVHMVNWLTLF